MAPPAHTAGAVTSAPAKDRLVAWAMTTGEAGMRSQARGLAEAVAATVVEKVVHLRGPWSWLPGHLAPSPLSGLGPSSDPIAPPWPDVLITCGRRSTAISIAIRKLSAGRTLTVHVQNPLCPARVFDLVVAMRHDGLPDGPNVLNVDTALHAVTPEKLAAGAAAWGPRFAPLPRPLIGVSLGGKNRQYSFTRERAEALLDGIARVRAATGAGVAITPSRRTEPEVQALIAERLGGDGGAYLWDGTGDNPYFGILALADRLIVTSDSVSMVSEALATGHPVETFDLEGSARRHGTFIRNLHQRGLARPFTGDPAPGPAVPALDATQEAAAAVRRLITTRAPAFRT